MPLHGEREARGILRTKGLDDAVRRTRLDDEAGRKQLHTLRVQRIHFDAAGARKAVQPSAWRQLDVVRRAVLNIELGLKIFAMIRVPLDLMDLLPEGAAERDIHLLKAAADGEQWNALAHDTPDQWQAGRIARGIVQRARIAGRSFIVVRLHIRSASGQQQSIQQLQQLIRRKSFAQRRDQQRHRIRSLGNGVDVLLADAVKRVMTQHATVRHDADEGFGARHAIDWKRTGAPFTPDI